MATYCITAANHKNLNDDRASEFQVWEIDVIKLTHTLVGRCSSDYVAKLIVDGHSVLSGKYDASTKRINTGTEIEIELRIAKNDKNYKITDLPEF